ncbi:pectate lyase [Nonomuraea turcica]|uniref:pectate lyase n=1 Tax=Nonomuraea sp. G32 TaxID=3067274 RepID=UPI00273C5AA9|nr:pectate lyase [Nonomuraea sp. G32]MDP4503322.1 pectate lyase [Nonomuraea sp. G32]
MTIQSQSRHGWRRLLATVAAMVMAMAGATAVTPPPAQAATVDTSAWYVLVNRHSGKALDVYNLATSDGSPIVQWPRNDGNWQQWQFVSSGSGYYRLKSRHSGKVLDVFEHSTAGGAQIVQWADLNGYNQQFRLADSDGGHVRLINRNSNKALEVWEWSTADGARISQWDDLNGANQQWQLVKMGSSSGGSGGDGSGAWPSDTGSVHQTTTRTTGSFFDGGMKRYYGIGDGGQSESQDPMFVVPNGGTIQNVIIDAPAGDGIHCEGSCTIRNVWWNDVGEDAATFKSSSSSATYLVDGGGAKSGSDKVFQHNGAGTVTIKNFQVHSSGKLYRACGNCSTSYQRHVVMDGVTARTTKVLAGINTNWGDTARFSRITVYGSAVICEKYRGVPKGSEPTKIGEGADGVNCLYSSSDITYR